MQAVASHEAPKPAAKPAETEEIDPLNEADLFLNFGRDAQAEEILKDALGKNPANLPVQLKLLSIYANRKDPNTFSTIARQIKDSGDAAAWEQAAALGRLIDPSNPMYGGGEVAVAETPVEMGMGVAAPPVDMDIGFNVPMDLDVTAAAPAVEVSASQVMDFDVSAHAGGAMDFDVSGKTAAPMDFDVSGTQQNAAAAVNVGETATLSELALNFDITGSQPDAAAAQHMDFDVTGSHPNVVAVAAQHMDFDVTGSHPGLSVEAAPEEENLSTLIMDAPMDFDLSATPAAAPSAVEEQKPADLELGGLTFDITAESGEQQPAMDMSIEGVSLDLGGEATTLVSPVAEAKKDEKWQEIATKLDLARAYHEMGDSDGAREILNEVLHDGDDEQREAAQALMQQL